MVRIRPTDTPQDNITTIDATSTTLSLTGPTVKATIDNNTNSKSASDQVVLRSFPFDNILHQETSQESTYKDTTKDIVKNVLNGYNGTVFCYGQTGSGKSHTIFGTEKDEGLLLRAISEIYEHDYTTKPSSSNPANPSSSPSSASPLTLKKTESIKSIIRKSSFYEIYNERVFDLLDTTPQAPLNNDELPPGLAVRNHPTTGPYIQNLTSIDCTKSASSCRALVNQGIKKRATAMTCMNDRSSRSHAVFVIDLNVIIVNNSGETLKSTTTRSIKSRLCFVDLAGSERQSMTNSVGIRLKEAGVINKSLLILGQVINELATKNSSV